MKVTYKGVEIESVSTDEILKVVRGLQRSAESVPVTINKAKKGDHAIWTAEEMEFLVSNLDKKASEVKKIFPFKTHTKNAITTMYYIVRKKDVKRINPVGREIMKAHSLL